MKRKVYLSIFYFEISIEKVPLHQQHDQHLENSLSHFVILNKVILNQKPEIFPICPYGIRLKLFVFCGEFF